MSKAIRELLALLLVLPLLSAACGDDHDPGPAAPTAKPDLAIQSITFEPPTPTTSEPVSAVIVVRNSGEVAAGVSQARIQVDGTASCDTLTVSGIGSGASTTITCALGQLAVGAHTVRACADRASALDEASESNNCLEAALNVAEGTSLAANLVVRQVTWVPAAPSSADAITATIVLRNSGNAAAASSHLLVRVDDTVVSSSVAVGALAAGAEQSLTCAFGPLAVGAHSIEACADATAEVAESDEGDNCGTDSLTVTEAPEPDLSIEEVTFAPAAPDAADSVFATIRVRNSGSGGAGASHVRIRVDGDTACPSVPCGEIAAGEALAISCSLGALAMGVRQVEACADIDGVIAESDESDNCGAFQVTVAEPPPNAPDLAIDSIYYFPLTPGPADTVTVRFAIRNLGGVAADPTHADILVDGLGRCIAFEVPAIAAGGVCPELACTIGPSLSGEHTVALCVDVLSEVTEDDEANNCIGIVVTVEGPVLPPDLRIEYLGVEPGHPLPGDEVTALFAITNDGAGQAAATITELSVDGVLICSIPTPVSLPRTRIPLACPLGMLSAGTHTLRATADAGADANETDETNNDLVREIVVETPGPATPEIGPPPLDHPHDPTGGAGPVTRTW